MPDLHIPLDRESEEPIYRQLIRHIRLQIESGTLTPGTRLPASRDLAQLMDVSRISVVNAYAELRAEGYLSAHAGRGTFVSRDIHPANGQASTPLHDHHEEMALPDSSLRDIMRLARRPGVINFSHGAPPTVADKRRTRSCTSVDPRRPRRYLPPGCPPRCPPRP